VVSGLALPQLTQADPEVAGEGSLDPLGLGSIAERLGDHLLPAITNRMRRPRLMTAMVVGSLATEGLEETSPPLDGRSTPSICFEWLLLESFIRRRNALALDELIGVPGTAKVTAVVERNERLTIGNYLKTANVFGFTGVLMPLARASRLLDKERRPAERATELALVWEREHGLDGFADAAPKTTGGSLRRHIRTAVDQALQTGHCSVPQSSHLLGSLAGTLGPSHAGPTERRWLLRAIVEHADEVALEIARRLRSARGETNDQELLRHLSEQASAPLRLRLEAIVAYEGVATRLEAVLSQWRFRSTLAGTTAVTAEQVAGSDVPVAAASGLADRITAARDTISDLDPHLATTLDELVAQFDGLTDPVELATAVMEHHHRVQSGKAPHGKRPWFEPSGTGTVEGFVVRPLYRLGEPPPPSFEHFGRPYRLAAYNALLGDLR
jgi:hypothetical protein